MIFNPVMLCYILYIYWLLFIKRRSLFEKKMYVCMSAKTKVEDYLVKQEKFADTKEVIRIRM
jgi:hypothetical protein